MQEIAGLAKRLLKSQDGSCPMEIVIQLQGVKEIRQHFIRSQLNYKLDGQFCVQVLLRSFAHCELEFLRFISLEIAGAL
jgi:hypothetical protein